MPRAKDLTGQRFGRLVAHGRAPTSEEEYEEALSRAVEAERESEN